MVLLKYKQRESKPNIFVTRFGIKEAILQLGTIDYDQEEIVKESEVDRRINELKSFRNRNYHSFTVNYNIR